MPTAVADLLAAALQLPPDQRQHLADQLLDSLDPPNTGIDEMTEEEFEAELNRRYEESLRDPSVCVPWEEVKRRMLGG